MPKMKMKKMMMMKEDRGKKIEDRRQKTEDKNYVLNAGA